MSVYDGYIVYFRLGGNVWSIKVLAVWESWEKNCETCYKLPELKTRSKLQSSIGVHKETSSMQIYQQNMCFKLYMSFLELIL